MIGTIRKHSAWLWVVIIGATIISFVMWGAAPATRTGSGRNGGLGTLYGHEVTADDYTAAKSEFFIQYWTRYQQWPDHDNSMTSAQMDREIYWRLLLIRKAASLGIHVGNDEVVRAANNLMLALGRNKEVVPMQQFVDSILTPRGLTAADLQRTLSDNIAIQQVVQLEGTAGGFVTPQEVAHAYDHDNQQYSAQAIFFSASNYESMVSLSPAFAQQFYTNYQAMYREPDRVVVSYVFFSASNYLAEARKESTKTNFEDYVDSYYNNHSADFADAKSPEDAKSKIREELIHDRAAADALQHAKDFATPLFAMDPPKAENLATVARQQGLAVRTTAPFSAADGPLELNVPPKFAKIAFELNSDTPYAGPVEGADGYYIIALTAQLPSGIPPYEQISARVMSDFKTEQALSLAQRVGTNFFYTASVKMATGSSFAQVAAAEGFKPVTLPNFALSTQDLADFTSRELDGVKQAAITTPVGHLSNFIPLEHGGMILYVKAVVPVDAAKKAADLPDFTARIRRDRISDVFNLWLQSESEREFRNIPAFQTAATDITK